VSTTPGRRTARAVLCAVVAGLSILAIPSDTGAADWAEERLEMVRTIESYRPHAGNILAAEGGFAPEVLEAMRTVERHRFVPKRLRSQAYADSPLPIGYGQTISQPFIVALMTHLLAPEPEHVVLEIGTGSGYQAAVLSPLVSKVCTIEIIPGLGREATERLAALGYGNVEVRIADGYHGWPECGPFDGIVVTAAADHVPPPLVDQLKPGGRMVIPVGGRFAVQYLTLVEKSATGEIKTYQLLPVRFVPFTRSAQ
jgi:protein-L-isoaspartate(D-aspartate) O-methyltransferase